MRTVHRVEEVWITANDVYTKCPENFTGVYYTWYSNGWLKYKINRKDGKRHGLSHGWYSNGWLAYTYNYKDGELID